jgi:hypothetical protein
MTYTVLVQFKTQPKQIQNKTNKNKTNKNKTNKKQSGTDHWLKKFIILKLL